MKLITAVRLWPENPQELLSEIERFNDACNALSERAFLTKTFGWLGLQRASYRWLRDELGFDSNRAILIVRKVAHAYSDKTRRTKQAVFSRRGGVPLYRHSYKKNNKIRLWLSDYRFVARQDVHLTGSREAKLVYKDGKFIIHQIYDQEPTREYTPSEWLGCDLGIVNLLTDSDGEIHSGSEIDKARRKYQHRRRNLQRNGSRSAKRKLQKLSGKQARYQHDINHVISKNVVAKAKDTFRGIALENLKGIRKGITARKAQRARHSNWGFYQLRQFIEYKSLRDGVPVLFVNPKNTSRTCPQCGYIDKKNRPNQSTFKCLSCGFAGLADKVAAQNIRARAFSDMPMVAA